MPSFALQRHIKYLPAALLLTLIVSGCHDTSEHEPRPLSDTPTEIDDDSDQPIRLSYVCGNRFVVVNSYSVPLSLECRWPSTCDRRSYHGGPRPAKCDGLQSEHRLVEPAEDAARTLVSYRNHYGKWRGSWRSRVWISRHITSRFRSCGTHPRGFALSPGLRWSCRTILSAFLRLTGSCSSPVSSRCRGTSM
jgi:hypothetical protein